MAEKWAIIWRVPPQYHNLPVSGPDKGMWYGYYRNGGKLKTYSRRDDAERDAKEHDSDHPGAISFVVEAPDE